MKVQKIKFNGLDFILPDGQENSPIVTIEDYKKGIVSYAHLQPDGKIIQYCKQIGTIKDIEFGEFVEIDICISEFTEGLLGSSWPL